MADPYTLDPSILPDVLAAPEFTALPFAERQKVLEFNLQGAANYVQSNGGWTPQTWKDFGELSTGLRQRVTESETLGEKARYVGNVAARTVGDTLAIATTAAMGTSPVLQTGETQVPMQTSGPAIGLNVMRGVEAVRQIATQAKREPLEAAVGELKRQIDEGEFLNDPQAWMDKRADTLNELQAQWYGEPDAQDEGAWRRQNHLLANPDNAALLGSYLRTRDPKVWQQLEERLYTTPQQARNAFQLDQLQTNTALGRALKPDAQPLIAEAADPFELAGSFYAVIKGAKALQRGAGAAARTKAVAAGVAGEMASEQGSLTLDQPLADFDTRKQVAKDTLIGALGLAGLGAGVQAVSNRLSPEVAANDTPLPSQSPPSSAQPAASAPPVAGAAAGAPLTPLAGIAQRGGRIDPTLPEDTGELTAEEVQDLETGRLGDLETGRRQPILQGVPDRPQQVAPFRESSINEEPIMEGDAITDLRIPRSPQAIAESQRIEAERQQQIATMRMLDARAQGMPLIPDSPSGSRDILDFANENPIYLPPGFSEERNLPEYEKLKEAKLPPYWRQFVASSKRGGNPSDVAQRAFDAGFIDAPTADAYLEAVRNGIEGRQQYRVQFAQRDKALQQEEKRVVNFEQSQDKLARKRSTERVDFEDIRVGDAMTIDGEAAVVRNIEYDQDGYLTNVVIEDGKRFGLMQFDPQTRGGILVDEFQPRPQRSASTPESATPESDLTPGFQHLVIDRDLEAGFMSGAGVDALIDLAHRAFAAGRTFSQWAAAMVQRFGAAVRDYLAAVWDHAKRSSQTGALNFTSRLGEQLQQSQQAASRLRNPASRATPAAMASDPGAAQNAEPSPGGLSEVNAIEIHDRSLNFKPVEVNFLPGGNMVVRWQGWGGMAEPGRLRNKIKEIAEQAFVGVTERAFWRFTKTKEEISWAKKGELKPSRNHVDGTIEPGVSVSPHRGLSVFGYPYGYEVDGEVIGYGSDGEPLLDPNTIKVLGPIRPAKQIAMEGRKLRDAAILANAQKHGWTVEQANKVLSGQFDLKKPNPESSRAAAGTSQSPRLEPPAATAAPLKAAYASALRGSSTAMIPLAEVFAAAQAANPALTQEQFQAQVMADYEAGSLMLEGAGSPQEAQNAGLRIDGTPVGTAVRMMVPQGFTHLDVSGQRSQAGFVINPLPALQRLATRVLPLHERGEPFRVQQLGARAILTGSPLPSDVTQVLAMTENERQAVAQSAAQVGRDLQAAVKAYLDRTGQDERATWDKINAVMEGQPGALTLLTAIDPALGERSRRARNMLDDLSAAVAQTLPTGSLRDAITQNQGSWMRRGYAAFDPESGWNFDGLTKAAKAGRQIGGKDAAKILANARAYLRSQNPQNGRTLKEWNADIEADMRDLMDRNAWQSANLGGNTLRKNVSSFMRRKEIAPEIRALMGEETNPLHRFIKSAAFQAQIVARHHGQTAVRALGLQTGLFSTQRGGVYTEEIEPSENRWSGLAGVWTTPEMKAALANSSAVNREGTDLGGWLVGTVKALGNEAKLNRVALNPDSWVVNILGNVVGLVQSGDVFAWDFARRLTDARALIKSGKARPGSMQTAAESALIDAQRAMLARLRGMGVIGSSITLADIEASIPRHLLQWVAEDRARNTGLGAVKGAIMGQAAGRGLGLPGRVVGGVAGGIGGAIAGAQRLQNWQQNVADYVMTGPDALARVTGWLTNYETALAAGQNPDQAAADATTRTLNTFPNYNALPALLRQLSRLGFTGSFIAFQWEVYRNFGWNVKYAIEELSSGNAAIQARGLRRLAGVGSVAALAGGGLAALLGAAGAAASDDEERNKIWRQWFAAPWEKDAVLAFDKYDKQGVSYYNTSYLLPQMTMMELIQGASEGRDPADSASRVLNRLSEQFIAGSVHLQPLLSAFANQDRFGRRITNAEGLAGAAARVDVAAQTILEPGFADKITRLTYALRQAEKNGRKFSVEEEMKRLAGIRQVSRTWEELVKRRYSQFTYDYQGVRDDANKMLGQNLPGAPVRAVKMVNDKVIELEQQLADYERDLRRLGVPETTIKAAKKDSSLQRLNPVRVRADGRRVEAVTVR